MTGNLGKAKEHLERVRLARGGTKCAEYQKLDQVIKQAETKGTK